MGEQGSSGWRRRGGGEGSCSVTSDSPSLPTQNTHPHAVQVLEVTLPSSTAPKALLLDWLGRDATGCVAVAGWLPNWLKIRLALLQLLLLLLVQAL